MEKLTTATGKKIACDLVSSIQEPPRLYLNIVNTSLADVAAVFSDKAETVRIWYGNYYFSGYTRLVSLAPNDGAVKVSLAKE